MKHRGMMAEYISRRIYSLTQTYHLVVVFCLCFQTKMYQNKNIHSVSSIKSNQTKATASKAFMLAMSAEWNAHTYRLWQDWMEKKINDDGSYTLKSSPFRRICTVPASAQKNYFIPFPSNLRVYETKNHASLQKSIYDWWSVKFEVEAEDWISHILHWYWSYFCEYLIIVIRL